MITCFTYGGANPYDLTAPAYIYLQQGKRKGSGFTVGYGLQVHTNLSYAAAAKELGECVMHYLSGEGMIDNSED